MVTQIGFSTSKSWVSSVIRFMTGSKASHVWFLYYDQDFRDYYVLDANILGFNITPLSIFDARNKIVKVFIPKHSIEPGFNEIGRWVSSKYDIKGLLGMFFVSLAQWFRVKIKNPAGDSKSLFCTEAVALAMKMSQYPGTEDWDCSSITPQFLIDFLTNDGSSSY